MNRTRILIIVLLSFACLIAPLATPADESELDRALSLNLKEAKLREVLRLYSQILDVGVNIEDVDEQETITIVFNHVSVRTTLNAICESTGYRWYLTYGEPRSLRFIPYDREAPAGSIHDTEKPISFDLVNAAAPGVFELAARILDVELSLDPALLDERISITRKNEPFSALLSAICLDLGCAWRMIDGNPPILEIVAD